MRHGKIIAVLGLLSSAGFVARADETPLYTTGAFAFSVEEITGAPLSVASTAEKSLSCLLGESVSMTAPDGTVSALSASGEACSWTPTAGGMWTARNSLEGEAVFTVRYSLFPGTQGAGTVADPLKIVDDSELVDLFNGGAIAGGVAFTLLGAHGIGSLALPPGYAVDGVAAGVWRLVAASGGFLYGSTPASFLADSRRRGPDRTVSNPSLLPPFAYSGDSWAGSNTAGSTLAFRSPDNVVAHEEVLSGWGAFAYNLSAGGRWTVMLEMDDGTILTSVVNYMSGFAIVIR